MYPRATDVAGRPPASDTIRSEPAATTMTPTSASTQRRARPRRGALAAATVPAAAPPAVKPASDPGRPRSSCGPRAASAATLAPWPDALVTASGTGRYGGATGSSSIVVGSSDGEGCGDPTGFGSGSRGDCDSVIWCSPLATREEPGHRRPAPAPAAQLLHQLRQL